jgi:hypothetical protein
MVMLSTDNHTLTIVIPAPETIVTDSTKVEDERSEMESTASADAVRVTDTVAMRLFEIVREVTKVSTRMAERPDGRSLAVGVAKGVMAADACAENEAERENGTEAAHARESRKAERPGAKREGANSRE